MELLPPELSSRISVYCQATGHSQVDAVFRILEIGLHTWETDPHFMPERVCGRVRTTVRH